MIDILHPPIQAILQPAMVNDQEFKTYAIISPQIHSKTQREVCNKKYTCLFHLMNTI